MRKNNNEWPAAGARPSAGVGGPGGRSPPGEYNTTFWNQEKEQLLSLHPLLGHQEQEQDQELEQDQLEVDQNKDILAKNWQEIEHEIETGLDIGHCFEF